MSVRALGPVLCEFATIVNLFLTLAESEKAKLKGLTDLASASRWCLIAVLSVERNPAT